MSDILGQRYWLDGQPIIIDTSNNTLNQKYWLDGQPIITIYQSIPVPPSGNGNGSLILLGVGK